MPTPKKEERLAPTSRPKTAHHTRKACLPVYSRSSLGASPELGEEALRRVIAEVRAEPRRLPLAAHRVGALVNAGKLPYQRTWDGLYGAALDAGAAEPWVRRCLFAGFAASNVSTVPSPQLWKLRNGVY